LYVERHAGLDENFPGSGATIEQDSTQMINSRSLLAAVVSFSFTFLGCGNKDDFNGGRAKELLEAAPVTMEGEQVTLTQMQVECGVQEDLWDRPTQFSPERSTARLQQKGRDLRFNDDVAIEPNRPAYIQIRGAISLQVDDVSNIRDGEENGTKLVDAKAGAKIQHSCFAAPLPLMGVKKGNFQADVPTIFRFRLHDDGWHVDKLVH
jgi:hypothetical protein